MGASCTIAFSDGKLHPWEMDDDEQKYPSQLAERFQVRLPIGLRDRIKAYAEHHGRSMNTEIVRILEREFPEPWPVDTRVADLIDMLGVLKGGVTDERIDKLTHEIEETVLGMMTGRVQGVGDRALENIKWLWERYQEQRLESARDLAEFDEEEERQLGISGRTEKFAIPPKLGNLSEDGLKVYKLGYEAGLAARHEPLTDSLPFESDKK